MTLKVFYPTVDGGWSPWFIWTNCTQLNMLGGTCGNGVKSRERLCLTPPQANNGEECDKTGYVEHTSCFVNCKGINRIPAAQ